MKSPSKFAARYGSRPRNVFDLKKSIKHIVASDVNKKWGKYMSDILKVDIDPKTNFPYLLPIQMHLD